MTRGSPFPGMDPYAEQYWGHVHSHLIIYAADMLNAVLGPGLVAATQQRIIIENEPHPERGVFPDVYIRKTTDRLPSASTTVGATGAAVAEPRLVEFAPETYKQHFIEILDARSGKQVVTVIEIVSPSNKRAGEARRQYEAKQDEVIASPASLVEVDLIRGRPGVTLAHKHNAIDPVTAPYHVSVGRGSRRGRLEVYDLALRDRLPVIRVPLRPGDADVALDLQELFDTTYRRGRCADMFDYDTPLEPALAPADARWAAERVAAWRTAPA